jgi:TonB family protein
VCVFPLLLQGQEKSADLPKVTSFDCPKYPSKAESNRLQGMVRLQVTTDGHGVSDVKVTSGHPLLAPEAFKNVRTWKFAEHTPTTINVDYFYVFQGHFKRAPASGCDAKEVRPSL